jgi:predicted nucleotide-binding protein
MTDRSAEFIAIAERASALAERDADLATGPLDALEAAAEEVGRSWSKSNLGYQANAYYKNFQVPPPGAMFSREWGFLGMFHGTTGEWEVHQVDQVAAYIEEKAGKPDLSGLREQSNAIRADVEALVQQARSVAAKIPTPYDHYVKENIEELQHILLPDLRLLARVQMQGVTGQIMTRDAQALEGGAQAAGHQIALANVRHIKSPYQVAKKLATVCERLGRHLEGEEPTAAKAVIQLGSKVFIGHGGASAEYLKLGVWLGDQGLVWEVFDRKPTAGMSTKERLLEMLDNAQIAFLLMTPEDEDAEGKMKARANVIHEVGLFQGRLGWMKAIVLLEEDCEEFSNIEGIGQIRYPRGNINAAFDEIRQVLQRESVL